MNFFRRQLNFRNYNLGVLAIVAAGAYLFLVALALAYLLYFLVYPGPDAIGATFEGLPAIALTAPTSLLLLPVTGPFDAFGPGAAVFVLVLSGLVQAFVLYVVLRGRRRVAPKAAAA
ncbi:SCO4225 family membrane protein [Kocuria sp. cx-455]|uniref:SCO4225 family membrane protein n=1 Tax=Kocuria sp. cx-455 TaxID=2771377 RepID=UPI003D70C0CA